MNGVHSRPVYQIEGLLVCKVESHAVWRAEREIPCDTRGPCASLLERRWGQSCIPAPLSIPPPPGRANKALPSPGCREVEMAVGDTAEGGGGKVMEKGPSTRTADPQGGGRLRMQAESRACTTGDLPGSKEAASKGLGTCRVVARCLLPAASPAGRKAGTSCSSQGHAVSGPQIPAGPAGQ